MARIDWLDRHAQEQGTYPVAVYFRDKNRELVDASGINSLSWWLTDLSGVVINSRSDVTISSITNPQYVVLTGADLQILDKNNGVESRIVTFKGTYTSTLGSNLALTYAVGFDVDNNLVIAADLFVSTADLAFAGDFVNV